MTARFVTFAHVAERFMGKTVAIVGSAPSVLDNAPGFIDSHDVVLRINNYKCIDERTGFRCDVHYSFFGTSIRKTSDELKRDGVKLCMCKLPDSQPIDSAWHRARGKMAGIDYRYIYRNRAAWWFCDTFVPGDRMFLEKFELLDRHQPTTGFSAILDVVACYPARAYLTGFDFFTSGLHNVDEPWREKNKGADPICHRPDLEMAWIAQNMDRHPMTFDVKMASLLRERRAELAAA